ncbi:MAG: hypothetical protein HY259_12165 [Chloroflexi bacterium]|nr:hypothetical protein [Chloroflexota bacterium]MBI3734191.1 hypothetical protein [Chloroflexota bacterium]
MTVRRALSLILASYIALNLSYGLATPLWEAPDEPSHYLYAEYLASHASLPTPQPPLQGHFYQSGYATSLYEWYQPPLYYTLVAAPLALFNALYQRLMPVVFPSVNPRFPHESIALFVHEPQGLVERLLMPPGPRLARLLSTALGILTLLVTFKLAATISAGDNLVALAATGFVAFIPQFTAITAYITSDNLADLIAGLCLLVLFSVVTRPASRDNRLVTAAGLLVFLGFLTKLTLLFLFPFGCLCFIVRAASHRSAQQLFGDLARFSITAIGPSLLWLAWTPTAQTQLTYAIASLTPRPEYVSLQYVLNLWPLSHASFWGRFGWMNVATPDWVSYLLDIMALAGVLGVVRLWYRCPRASVHLRAQIPLLGVVCLLVLAGFIRFNLAAYQPQGRLLYAALPAFAILISLGLLHLSDRRRVLAAIAMIALPLILNIVSLVGSLMPAYSSG